MKTDVLVIGSGIVGTAVSRELSRYNIKVTLIEKEVDIAFGGPTKANTAIIHAGYDDEPGTLASRLCPRGNSLWTGLASELGIPFRRPGSLAVAFDDAEIHVLEELLKRGNMNCVPNLEMIERKHLLKMEPNLSKKAVGGLFAPTGGMICPYEAAIALAENARLNGVKIISETCALGMDVMDEEVKAVQTNRGIIHSKYIINAAGLFADQISAMAGIEKFRIVPRKGEYVVYDKDLGGIASHVLFPIPTQISKGILVSPTVDGNIIVGPNAHDVENKNDTATTSDGIQEVLTGAFRLIPKLSELWDRIISTFAGLRPESSSDNFIIESYSKPHGFINVAGIKSPGLTSAPAIAEMVADLLKKDEDLILKKDFKPFREPIIHHIREFNFEVTKELMDRDARYGHVVCRCEHVTEGEIVEAIRRGATTLDGVKFRTRAGMGRCQGGFCTPHVAKIIAGELEVPVENVTKKGGDSNIVLYPSKRLLTDEKDD